MPHINNIFNIKVNSVQNNASINFGNTIHKGHNANQKQVGGQYTFGDANPASMIDRNAVGDSDFVDQPQKQV